MKQCFQHLDTGLNPKEDFQFLNPPLPNSEGQVIQHLDPPLDLSIEPYWDPQNPPVPSLELPQDMRELFMQVVSHNKYNFQGARIPLQSGLNIDAWRKWAVRSKLPDIRLCDYMDFGWPAGYRGPTPNVQSRNHPSSFQYKTQVDQYFETEVQFGAVIGPLQEKPFDRCQISPLMTRVKNSRSTKRRTIVDVSWPPGSSINDFIDSRFYLAEDIKFTLPQADSFTELIMLKGPASYMYSVDLARAYRQLRNCPTTLPLLCYNWQNKYYVDRAPCFGLRTSASFMQRTSCAIKHFMAHLKYLILSYIDDMAGVESSFEISEAALSTLVDLLVELGVQESVEKRTLPCQVITWIGTIFDSVKFTMSIPQEKLSDIKKVVHNSLQKDTLSRREMQSLIGKCLHVAHCSKPARLFVNSLLNDLRQMKANKKCVLSEQSRMDLLWFRDMLPEYNGVHFFTPPPLPSHLQVIIGVLDGQCYAAAGPEFILEQPRINVEDSRLYAISALLAISTWAEQWAKYTVNMFVPNSPTLQALQSGATSDPVLQNIVREIWKKAAIKDINLWFHQAMYLPELYPRALKLSVPSSAWQALVTGGQLV